MKIVGIGGFSSNVGKTTLVCRLLEQLPGWEAIKVTKGHYRSCGKDPHACCVSHLLSDSPRVISERKQTDVGQKDTARYWQAGASNVHWVIATKDRVADGVREALARVDADCPGVLVEGTGYARDVAVDFMVLVTTADPREIKRSTITVLDRTNALYVSDARSDDDALCDERVVERVRAILEKRRVAAPLPPVFWADDLPHLLENFAGRQVR